MSAPRLQFVPMNRSFLAEMDAWTYGRFLPDFDLRAYRESADPMKGPGGCDGYAVLDDFGGLVGLFEVYLDEGTASIGLALRPELTGRGSDDTCSPPGSTSSSRTTPTRTSTST